MMTCKTLLGILKGGEMKKFYFHLATMSLFALTVFTHGAWAATCTSMATGNWNTAGTWSCTAGNSPAAGDTVIIASPHTVTLNNNASATNLTINAGATLFDNGRRLTLSGNAVVNGTFDGTGNNGQLRMTGAGSTLSGSGTFLNVGRIQINGGVTIPVGSTLELTLQSEIRVDGTLTINGAITGIGQTPGNRILRVNNGGALAVGATGSINAPNAVGEVRNGGAATNSGSVILQGLTTQGGGSWTNAPAAYCNAPPVCPPPVFPVVNFINMADTNPATTTNVSWTVVFSNVVTGVDAGDFTLVQGAGMIGATITSVTGSGTTWTVVASTAGNTGTLGLNLVDNDSIRDVALNPLGGAGAGNGNFTGQVYTVDPPSISGNVTANPTVCVNDTTIGTQPWGGLGNVTVSDDNYATASGVNSQITNFLKCTGYNFGVPAGAIINGISVGVENHSQRTMNDYAVQLVKTGVIQATNYATYTRFPNPDAYTTYGSATDLWSNSWTSSDINSANFGVAFAAQRGPYNSNDTAFVDHMPITVYYTQPSYPTVSSIDLASANPTSPASVVSWTVTFSIAVTGVDVTDFALIQGGGVTGAAITSVTGGGMTWTVSANTGSGSGTLRLRLVDDDTISSGTGKKLGGTGVNNGNFNGQAYDVEIPVCNGTMIFCDDFERANPGSVGNGWVVAATGNCNGQAGNTGCAGIDTDIPPFNATTNRANPTSSMFTRWTNVSVTSKTIDLSVPPAALLSFWMRRGGDAFSEYPEGVGEDYLIQYLDNLGSWKILAQYPTGVMEGEVFTPVIQLPPDALHANFKIRFLQPNGSGCCGMGGAPGVIGYDYWHIDDVIVSEAPESSYVGAFCDNFEAGGGRWSFSAEGAPGAASIGVAGLGTTDFLSATHELDMRWGYVVASTLRTDITGVSGNIDYWLKSGTTGARDPDNGENLLVEYYNSGGTWTTLATYLGTAAAGTVYNGSHVLPANAKHSGFRLRFRMLNGSGFDNDYWHIDDVCVGTLQPNADLSITKTRGGPLVPGSNASYTLTVTNNGPDTLSGSIEVKDSLPTGLTYYSGNGTGWTCSSNPPLVTCSYVGTVNNGASAPPITLTVAVDAGASGIITNAATVTGTVTDNNPANNSASDTATILPGFLFTDSICVNGIAIGDPGQTCDLVNWTTPLIAGANRNNVYITAKNVSGVPTRLSQTSATIVNMQFGLSCINPVANAGVQSTFSASPTELPLCEANGAAPSSWSTGVNLSFPGGIPSVGPYSFNYEDVGQVELHMRNSAAITQTGSSGAFVVKPDDFVLSAIQCTNAIAESCGVDALAMPTAGNNPAASVVTGGLFIPAGDAFTVTVTAVDFNGNATPNFGKELVPESVKLTPTNSVALSLPDMVMPPAIVGSFGTFNNGVATGTVFSWSEVGIIALTPSVADGNFLGIGDVTGALSGNVGRFYPKYFETVVNQISGVPMNCPVGLTCPANYNGAVYSGQEFNLNVTAMNASGGVTQNYNTTTGFAKATALTSWGALGTTTAPTGSGNLGIGIVSAFAAGMVNTVNESYIFTSPPTAPTDIYIRAIDADNVSSQRVIPATSVEGGVKVVSGRIKVSNAYGSEKSALNLTADAQYFTVNGWLNSTTDNSTTLTLPASYPVGAGSAAVTLMPGSGTLVNGQLDILLAAPDTPGVATIIPTVPAYLQLIEGTATFGVYKGGGRYIYLRENY